MKQERFLTGCRYWPRTKGPFFFAGGFGRWELGLWDVGEVRDELSHVADVGFDFVRVGLPWAELQPSRGLIRSALLNRLVLLLDAAEAAGLTVQLTILGQLGGTLFVPYWLLAMTPEMALNTAQKRVITEGSLWPWRLGNFYEDSSLLAGQTLFWGEMARHFGAHPALTEIDLSAGGLLSTLPPTHPDQAFRWWERLSECVAQEGVLALYSDGPELLMQSTNHVPRLHEWQATVGRLGIATTVMGSDGQIDVTWPLFQMQLARTLAQTPVGCISLGVPTSQQAQDIAPTAYREEEQARFFQEVLPALYHLGVPFICHTNWADALSQHHPTPPYDESIPLRHSGLLRSDGREKEAASVWRSFHSQLDKSTSPTSTRPLDIDQDEWYHRRHQPDFITTWYQQYRHGEI